MGSGQLGVAFFDRVRTAARPRETIAVLSAALAAGLAELGITASFRGKNDLEVRGRKIAGLGLYVDQSGAMLFHASVLADLDVAFMLQVLKIPAAKLADRAAPSVAERLTTVSAETGVAHDATTLRPVIAAGFAAAFGIELQLGTPEAPEQALAQALEAARYGSESWLNERGAAEDSGGTALLKTPAGLARIYLSTHGDLIKSAMVVGDFNELPPVRRCYGVRSALAAAGPRRHPRRRHKLRGRRCPWRRTRAPRRSRDRGGPRVARAGRR